MTDPFQNLSDQSDDMLQFVGDTLEQRAEDPAMIPIIDAYLDEIDWSQVRLGIEVGCGTGPICRMMAARSSAARIVGIEPAAALVARGEDLAAGLPNLSFLVGGGQALPFDEGAVDLVVMHTVLSHVPSPEVLLAEAKRVLRAGGTLVICDGDFSRGTLGNALGDPLQAMADYFTHNFVTDRYLTGKLRALTAEAGFDMRSFVISPRVVTDNSQMAAWIRFSGAHMVERGLIGQPLVDALVEEYERRRENGTLLGFQAFVTLIAETPSADA